MKHGVEMKRKPGPSDNRPRRTKLTRWSRSKSDTAGERRPRRKRDDGANPHDRAIGGQTGR